MAKSEATHRNISEQFFNQKIRYKMSDTKQKALDFLQSNTNIKEVFATSDGILFIKKADAINHAKVLDAENPKVETFGSTEAVKKEERKKLSIAELKAIKADAVTEYTKLFESAPDEKLSTKDIRKLVDAKKAELANENN
jgi:hypothetical protein